MGTKPESSAVLARRIRVARRRRERSRLALMTAAFELLGKESGSIGSVDAVAKQAAVTRGTFYNHYPRLEDLLSSLSDHITRDFNLKILAHVGQDTPPPEQATFFIKAYLKKAALDPRWGWNMVNLAPHGPLFGVASNRLSEGNIRRGLAIGDYTCASVSAGSDIASGALFAGIVRIVRKGETGEYISGITRGTMLALGVVAERADDLALRPLPVNFDLGAQVPKISLRKTTSSF